MSSRLKLLLKFSIMGSMMGICLVLYQNCGDGFKALELSESSMSPNGINAALAAKGEVLYKANCLACHGQISGFAYKNVPPEAIQEAIDKLIPQMSILKGKFTPADLAALAEAVKRPPTSGVNIACNTTTDYGKTTIRRLNDREFQNSIRELFQDSTLTVQGYPQGRVSSGFDNDQDAVRTHSEDLPELLTIAETLISSLKAKSSSVLNSCNSQGGGSATTKNTQQIACAKNLISTLAKKAYKKAPLATELAPLNTMIDQAGNVQEGVGQALSAMILAPQFAFHVIDYAANRQGVVHTLNNYELAARMSYFIWSSLPDDQLINLAQSGQLANQTVVAEQVRRMLKDPKAQEFVTRFTRQWLDLARINAVVRSPGAFPEFSQGLKDSMVKETLMLFQDTFNRSLPLDSVLTANYSFLDKQLADHYKVPFAGSNPDTFTSHMMPTASNRTGFLSHAGIMTITSTEAATSPVKRGHFLLDMVLCEPTDDPPQGAAEGFDKIDQNLPIRERLAQHSRSSGCASCHKKMDPVGFAYENFDPIGRYRTHYQMPNGTQVPVDSSGIMPDGFKFTVPTEVPTWFASGVKFEKCVNKYMSSMAVSRLFKPGDICAANSNIEALAKNGQPITFESLVEALVTSDLFKKSKVQE